MLINVLDCASPEAAIAMAIDGDRVCFPGIQKYVAPIGGYQLTKNIEVFGDGPGRADGYNGTLILPNSAADAGGLRNVFCIAPGANVDLSAVCIHDLRINVNQTPALGSAIYCKLVAGSNHRVRAVRIERVTAFNVLGNIVHLEGANLGTEYIESVVMTECATTLGGNFGVFLLNVWLARLMMSTLIANAGGAGYFESSGVGHVCR